jgi:hypothetical protein
MARTNKIRKRRGVLFILDATILSILAMAVLGGIIAAAYHKETATPYYALESKAYELGNLLIKSKVNPESDALENYSLFFNWIGKGTAAASGKISKIVKDFADRNPGICGRVTIHKRSGGASRYYAHFDVSSPPQAFSPEYTVSFTAPICVLSGDFYYMEVKLHA